MTEIKTNPNIILRILAGLIDYGIIYAFTFFMVFNFGEPNDEGGQSLNGFMALIPVGFWLIMTVVLESGLGGTLGNSILGLKVIPENGQDRKLDFGESLLRHLVDPIDMFLFFGVFGILIILKTPKNQRLGDLWAGTIVVKTKNLEKTE